MLQFSIAPSCFRKEVRKIYTWPDVEVELYIWVCNLQQHLSHFASQILSDLRVGRTFLLLAFYHKPPCQNTSFKSGWLMHSDCDPCFSFSFDSICLPIPSRKQPLLQRANYLHFSLPTPFLALGWWTHDKHIGISCNLSVQWFLYSIWIRIYLLCNL